MALSKGLSPEDKSVLYIATGLENGIVITSDNLVRKCTERLKLECHVLLWVIDQLVLQNICSKPVVLGLLKILIDVNKHYLQLRIIRLFQIYNPVNNTCLRRFYVLESQVPKKIRNNLNLTGRFDRSAGVILDSVRKDQ
ncbi:hypothetical protein [Mongoliitalea daihaiensis]|uniref:hypothetical protein n=1 Tax=Mongoliitalea daihaiensis TaxID=2782006 RepID=UPI001F267B14|nr:hypothetical protein [Mongoliitalea daihaiensis]UJP65160.1 hypothetical protein IPZ59_00545 [Mongoliitalea daihaiensis]